MPLPSLILGTARWGDAVGRQTAHDLLSAFYQAGYREVDTATNYPINKNPADFRRAEQILTEWIKAHGVNDLKITAKVGSVNNMRSPEHILTRSFLLMCLDEYRRLWGPNLDTLMIHWDNRDDLAEIDDSLQALAFAAQQGLRPGLSGITRPDLYAEANRAWKLDFRIQFKHNIFSSDYDRYKPFHGTRRFVAYGILAGGTKPGPEVIEAANQSGRYPPIQHFYQLGLAHALSLPDMESVIIGPSKVEQLEENLLFFEVYKGLRGL
jgi:aryl-alcohol dehydrogenase-like predicted oxidoreductase